MGDLEGVGRIYRPELNANITRSPHVDKTERDKHHRHREEGEQHEEEPHDTVELHEIDDPKANRVVPVIKPVDPNDHVDISA